MALQLWLPLNGTLENKGCADAVITNNGATVDTVGKTGSCYSFDGSDDMISINCQKIYDILGGSQPFSMTIWVYRGDSTRAILFGDYKISPITDKNFVNLELSTDNHIYFYWGNGTGYDRKLDFSSVVLNQWSHIAVTYDGNFLKGYLNGELQQTVSANLYLIGKTSGEYRLGRDSRTGTTALKGKLNDFRLYDHCLSAAEVHEISQGLTLHYKLDFYQNWIIDYGERSLTRSSGSNLRLDYSFDSRFTSFSGTQFMVDFDAKGSANNMVIDVYLRTASGGFTPSISKTLTTKWTHYTIEFTGNPATAAVFSVRLMKGTAGDVLYIKNVHLVSSNMPCLDTKIIDSSGYGHHGISHNAYLTSETLARYSNSIDLTNTESYISGEYYASEEITFCAWVRFKTKKAAHVIDGRTSNGSGYQPFYCNTNGTIQTGGTGAYPNISCSFQIDRWYHYAVAYNSETIKCYVDGELIGSAAKGNSFNTMIPLTLASRCNQANYSDVYLSDFRIYCTALSQDDIKDLYQTSAKVDKLGNIHTFEFIEDDAMKIKKTGTACNKEILENHSTIIHTSNGVTFKPSTGTNKCSSNFSVVDMSNYLESDHPINISVDFDLEWTNFAFVEGKTPFLKIQGMNRKRADGSYTWTAPYPITNGFSLLQFMDSTSGNCHAHYVTTIPVAWLELYKAQQVQIRCDYSDGNGTVKISNFIVTLGGDSAKFTKSYISANEFIER